MIHPELHEIFNDNALDDDQIDEDQAEDALEITEGTSGEILVKSKVMEVANDTFDDDQADDALDIIEEFEIWNLDEDQEEALEKPMVLASVVEAPTVKIVNDTIVDVEEVMKNQAVGQFLEAPVMKIIDDEEAILESEENPQNQAKDQTVADQDSQGSYWDAKAIADIQANHKVVPDAPNYKANIADPKVKEEDVEDPEADAKINRILHISSRSDGK